MLAGRPEHNCLTGPKIRILAAVNRANNFSLLHFIVLINCIIIILSYYSIISTTSLNFTPIVQNIVHGEGDYQDSLQLQLDQVVNLSASSPSPSRLIRDELPSWENFCTLDNLAKCVGCVFVLLTLYCDPSYLVQFCGEKQNDVDPPPPGQQHSLPPLANQQLIFRMKENKILVTFYNVNLQQMIEG